ncbi:motility associated factor glycosyltransferase family protein [Peribacillus asahii]|uniref:motility associated factor glycosyltransferase family protein n=1 Tax=Peribacillus asahii TaxID=228899 RepID=UPI00207A1D71|nr:6-hydroxymethylpterin diphosphokinase MptE-like protein [Peribacillus asahii]USK69970.1 DUF115 domain-containing protein [Peribacillus asahii]
MILIDNRNYVRIHNRTLMEKLIERESVPESEKNIAIELSKKGTPTLKMNVENKVQYVHSKYDPETEAERLIKQLQDVDQYEHVLFIGAGLGYHIKALLKEYPDMKFSIYEPDLDVLCEFLSQQDLTELPIKQLEKIFTTTDNQQLRLEVSTLNQLIKGKTYLFILPIYKNLYNTQIEIVMESFVEVLKDKANNLATNAAFQKRWTINSIKNFPKVLETPNILHDIDKEAFKDKPAIIVAAGPSLNEEFENLKYIKENGLAYIFSVGSAINALIEHGIYPDAACTYDPTEKNQLVFEKLKERNITDIPLVFGSSVGFETLENYPGKMLHMLTSQDTIAPYYINNPENINVVLDAPSIAVVTFQLLKMLGCSQIILVGQNLAFQNNSRYAEGINYDSVKNELSDQEKKGLLIVKDVYGNDIQTNDGFNRMRQQLETYINIFKDLEVINTTKGGAHIEGTIFMPLSEVIAEKWNDTNNVKSNWFVAENSYDLTYTLKQINNIQSAKYNFEQTINSATKVLREINAAVSMNKVKELEKKFTHLDKEFKKLRSNLFFKAFIEPMIRVHNQRLAEESQAVRFDTDLIKKGRAIAHVFTGFLMDCQEHIGFVQPLIQDFNVGITILHKIKVDA